MNLNSVIFPAPKCSYSKDSRNLIWVCSTPENTPVYHVEARKKARELHERNKENVSKLTHTASFKPNPPSFSLFGMCMNSQPDTINEVEVMGGVKPITIEENARQEELDYKRYESQQLKEESPFARLATESLPQSPPYPSTSFQKINDASNQSIVSPAQRHKQFEGCTPKNITTNGTTAILDQINNNKCLTTSTKQQQQDSVENASFMFNSPIRVKKQNKSASSARKQLTDTPDSLTIHTPLKRAAEFGPELKNIIPTKIPCLYLPYADGSNKLLIYFHGNAEDLGYSYDFISNLRRFLKLNVLAVEYPGYGLYEGSPNSDQILADADSVYEFARTHLKVPAQDIIIFGRSIGSGPASYIAGTRNIGALILMCPYTSIRGVAKNVAGELLSYLVADRFRNVDYLKHAKIPSLLIHGEKDRLIPFTHSIELMKSLDQSLIHLSAQMTHNDFDLLSDLIQPIKNFFKKSEIVVSKQNKISVPHEYYSSSSSVSSFSSTTIPTTIN